MRKISTLFVGASALAILAGSPAFAQGTAPADQPPLENEAGEQAVGDDSAVPQAGDETEPNADGTPADSGTITVTGSRIRRPNFESFEPIVTVDERYIEERNLTNVADAINELPGVRGSITPNGAQGSFGQGVNFVNIFGLGSNRTLTLINGRRVVSANVPTLFNQGSAGTQVDLNIIPVILIDRVDVVTVGGAPVYGSDAIAGTVNVILKNRFEGIEVNATSGITEEGDNFRYNIGAVAGFNFAGDRGNITLSASHDEAKGMLYNSRDFLRRNIGNATNPCVIIDADCPAAAGSRLGNLGRPPGIDFTNDGRLNTSIGFNDTPTDTFPGTVIINDVTLPFLTGGGLITGAPGNPAAVQNAVIRNFMFNRQGELVPFNRGITFPGTTASGGDGFRFNDYSQITSDVRRTIFGAFLNFEVSEALRFFAEGSYYRSRQDELVQQPTFNSSLFGGTSGPLTFDVTSAFLTPQARLRLQQLGVNAFQISRASLDLADLTGFSENEMYRIVAGFKGDFKIGSRDFNYEVSANYGRTDVDDTRQNLDNQKFINAVNVRLDGSGNVVCDPNPVRQAAPGGTPVADAACVPLNLLGEGLSSQAARDYVIAESTTTSTLEQLVFNANVGGSFFDILGNPLSFNLGVEHREERGVFDPSDFDRAGLGRSVAIAGVEGKYNVDEIFGEVLLPLITPSNNITFLHRLEFFARGRYVDNTVNGGFFSWALGGTFAPIRDVEFRGNYTKSFRAPAITELFLPVSNSFVTVPDLCSAAARIAGPAPATRTANCLAFLAVFPNATPLDAAAATVPGRSGGNPNLENEVAKSFTYGVILRPRFIPGLTLSADYVSIRINNPIANLTVAQIASACFDNPQFNAADPANGNSFCSFIRRNPPGTGTAANGGDGGGQVPADPANPAVTSGFINGNQIKFSGVQGSFFYRRPLSGLGLPGTFEAQGDMLYVRRRVNDITGVAPVRQDGVSVAGSPDPKWAGQLNVRYIGEGFGVTTSFNYLGDQLFARTPRGRDIREIDHLRQLVTVNGSVYIDATQDFRLTLSVTNLFNRHGQGYFGNVLPASYTIGGGSDLLGRRFAVSARMRF